jgi:glutamate racemase
VKRVEDGATDDPDTEALLREYLMPMLEDGIDSLVLGCTHYPFLRPTIERVVGPGVVVIDPAPAVANQTRRVVTRRSLLRQDGHRRIAYYTSGDPGVFESKVRNLVDIPGLVQGVHWEGNRLVVGQSR